MSGDGRLVPFVEDRIWMAEADQRFLGIEMGTRTTVVRLADGRLWVHSPIAPDAALVEQLRALGDVAAVIAPNRLHHLYVAPFLEAFPEAALYGSRVLPKKRPDLTFDGVLGDTPEPLWADTLDQVALGGRLFLDEVVFFARAARTLILTDLCQEAHAESSRSMRFVGRLFGIYERHAPPPDLRLMFRADKRETRRVVSRLLEWDFDRVILAHGALVHDGGHEVIERALGFARDW